jgi:uncharacterized membrane protein
MLRFALKLSTSVVTFLFLWVVLFIGVGAESASAHKDHDKPHAKKVEEPKAPAAIKAPALSQEPVEVIDWSSVPIEDSDSAEGVESDDSYEEDHEDEASNVPAPLAWLGRFHPPLTHFPIALLVAAAIAEALFIRRPMALFEDAARFCVWIGTGGALAAALLGWFYAGFHIVDDEWVMTTHRWFGTGTALWSILVFVLCERVFGGAEINTASRKHFRIALFVGAGLVSVTGFFGGALLYGIDHYTS